MIKRILLATLATSSIMFATNIAVQDMTTTTATTSEAFFKKMLLQNKGILEIQELKTLKILEVSNDTRWKKSIISYKIKLSNNKVIEDTYSVISDGEYFVQNLMDKEFNDVFLKDLNISSLYTDDNLVIKAKNPKNNIVIFSDFQCPYCVQEAPKKMKEAADTNDTNVYYYNFPLKAIHKDSDKISLCVITAFKKYPTSKFDILNKVYSSNIVKLTKNEPSKTVEEMIVIYNDAIQDYNITKEDVLEFKAQNTLMQENSTAVSFGIAGTPTVFLNGKRQ